MHKLVKLRSISYPPNTISPTLRRSAWLNQPLGLYPHEGVDSDFSAVMKGIAKQFSSEQRADLQRIFQKQMPLGLHATQNDNLLRLSNDNTFVVVTGQQIHLGLGPMYVVYKIASAIVMCNDLQLRYPDAHFVPVFWMASEDHDVAEINHLDLFKDRYTWGKHWENGVGAMPTQDLSEMFDWMASKLVRNESALTRINQLRALYLMPQQTLATATSSWITDLFAEFGLLVIDPSDVDLKKWGSDVIGRDLFTNDIFNAFESQKAELKNQGIEALAFARPCNLFWMGAERRLRLIKTGAGFETSDQKHSMSEDQVRAMLALGEVRAFSPNVLLRPLYQQQVLPCIAYVAGPSEYMYWLQTTKAFTALGITAPVLLHRMGGVILNSAQQKKMDKLGLMAEDAFQDLAVIKDALIKKELGENVLLQNHEQTFELLQDYLRTLYQWKSTELAEAKKQIDSFLRWQKDSTGAATDQRIDEMFSQEGWQGAATMLQDVFSKELPQDRKLFWLQEELNGGKQWLRDICSQKNYSADSAFWVINT